MNNENMKKTIKKFIKHFNLRDIKLYGEEYYIAERILPVLKQIKENDYSYSYNNFWPDTFEGSCILLILDQLWLLEWWTSIRNWWIEHDIRDIFDMLIELIEKDYSIINFCIEQESSCMRFDYNDNEHIDYLYNLLKLWVK